MNAPAMLFQLNISAGGMPKLPVDAARVGQDGVEGDWQNNRKHHGGPDRAICLYSIELYESLRRDGFDLAPGAIGENFTTRGVDLQSLQPGTRLRVGSCTIEISKVRTPCVQLRQWGDGLERQILGRAGWLARVLVEGVVRRGDAIERLEPAEEEQ